ncbi:YggT family protein [Clostridium ihumii]|uniref:YggT family protein n=1 Tax=Clostridium ihumii TaxID=1470356 RepID=UPI00058D4CC7|nr:YggT family protein [Clostridium ihumii]
MTTLLINIVTMFFEVIKFAILIEVLLSWVPNGRNSKVWDIVRMVTRPIMEPCEKLNDMIFKGFVLDFSPIIAYFLIYLIEQIIITVLFKIF